MIKLKSILTESDVVDAKSLAAPFFKEFSKQMKTSPTFSYLGLTNKEHVFSAPIEDLGTLKLIFSKAEFIAKISESHAYFGIVYLLNGLEQFDATVCLIQKTKNSYETKLFDDDDSNFSDSKTNFASLIKNMTK